MVLTHFSANAQLITSSHFPNCSWDLQHFHRETTVMQCDAQNQHFQHKLFPHKIPN